MWSAPGRERIDLFVGARAALAVARRPAMRLPWRRASAETDGRVLPALDLQASDAALAAWLAQALPRGGDARIVVSESWIRHAWAPGAAALRRPAERCAAAAGTLRGCYGDRADDWVAVLGTAPGETGAPASGIDRRMMERLQRALAASRIRALAIEPLFVDAFNAAAASGLLDGACWFVTLEPGRAVIATLADGRLAALRSQRLAAPAALPAAIELARLSDGLPRRDGGVVVACPGADAAALACLVDAADYRVVDLADCSSMPEAFR